MNLLPPTELKKIRRGYVYRLISVTCFLLALSFLLVVVFIAPSYFVIRERQASVENSFTLLKKPVGVDEKSVTAVVRGANQKVAALLEIPSASFTPLLQKISKYKPSGVSVRGMIYNPKNIKTASVTVQGVAASRESLVSFINHLKTDGTFSQIDVPISNFAKGQDIDFSVSFVESL